MKLLLTTILVISSLISTGQMKGNTITPPHGGMPYPDPMQPISRDTIKPCTRCWPKIKDITPPSFHDIVFLMQQNMELSQHIDRLENRNDSLLSAVDELHHELSNLWGITKYNATYSTRWEDSMETKLNSIERRPIIYIDTLHQQLWVKCPDGSCDIFIRKL